jgi:uncharacterized protein (TIGR03382 family)
MGRKPVQAALFLLIGGVLAALQPAPLATIPGQAGYWKLDETAVGPVADSAGTNAGAYVGTPVRTAIAPPALTYADAMSLETGTNNGVTIPNFGTFTRFSVSAWINGTGTLAARQSIVSYKESNGAGFVLCLNEDGTTRQPRIWCNIGGAWIFAEETFTIANGAWVHLAATYDGSNLRLYRDGTNITTTAIVGAMTQSTSPMVIGGRNSADMHWFPGLIDDVRVYDKALTADEVLVLQGGVPEPTGLSATNNVVGAVNLAWSAPAGMPATVTPTYVVRRAPAGTTTWTVVASGVTATSWTDPSPPALGVDFDYVVTALSVAESGEAGPATGRALAPPPRTEDHDEGLFGSNCSCGAGIPRLPGATGLLALAALLLAVRRRR